MIYKTPVYMSGNFIVSEVAAELSIIRKFCRISTRCGVLYGMILDHFHVAHYKPVCLGLHFSSEAYNRHTASVKKTRA
jgi:hypothetical protein